MNAVENAPIRTTPEKGGEKNGGVPEESWVIGERWLANKITYFGSKRSVVSRGWGGNWWQIDHFPLCIWNTHSLADIWNHMSRFWVGGSRGNEYSFLFVGLPVAVVECLACLGWERLFVALALEGVSMGGGGRRRSEVTRKRGTLKPVEAGRYGDGDGSGGMGLCKGELHWMSSSTEVESKKEDGDRTGFIFWWRIEVMGGYPEFRGGLELDLSSGLLVVRKVAGGEHRGREEKTGFERGRRVHRGTCIFCLN